MTVNDNPELGRYEIFDDDELAGIVIHELTDGQISLKHTEIFPDHSGNGLAAALVTYVLDDARRRQLRVVPVWPYVREFIDENAEQYLDLVPENRRDFRW